MRSGRCFPIDDQGECPGFNMDCFRSAGRRREALKIPQGILRELVKLSCASLGIDCSGCPRKHLLYKGL